MAETSPIKSEVNKEVPEPLAIEEIEKPKESKKKEEKTGKSHRKHETTLLSKDEIVKRATNFPFPEEAAEYLAEEAVQKNVLIIGKAGSGKTTLLEILKNPSFQTSFTQSFFATGSKEAIYTPLVVRNSERRAYSINIIDTPGIYEIRASNSDSRSNEQIVKIIQDIVTHSITHLSAIILTIPIDHVINEEDINVLSIFKGILGDSLKKNTLLVFTKCEQHQFETLAERLNEFLSSEVSLPFLDLCQGGIRFSGAISGEMAKELGTGYETKIISKVVRLRQNILETIVALEDVNIDIHVDIPIDTKPSEAKPEVSKVDVGKARPSLKEQSRNSSTKPSSK